MVDIQSKEVIDKMSEELKVQPSMSLPRTLVNNIQPTFEVGNRRPVVKIAENSLIDGTNAVILTTHATKRTFIIGYLMSLAKDVVATSLFSTINAVPLNRSGSQTVSILRYEPVTAGQFIQTYTFPIPMELEPNTTVNFTHSLGVASIDGNCVIYFFELDPE